MSAAASLQASFARLEARVAKLLGGAPVLSTDIAQITDFALDANDAGRGDLSIALLEPMSLLSPGTARIWQILALALREEQRSSEAVAAFARAAEFAPQDALIAVGHAQSALESGRCAVALFRVAQRLMPDNPELLRSAAAALASEGQVEAAITLLNDMVRTSPSWVAGHETLSLLRWLAGADASFADNFRQAIAARPQDMALRIAYHRTLSSAGFKDCALAVIHDARAAIGDHLALDAAEAGWAAENGDPARADILFAKVGAGAGIELNHIRHALRQGRLDQAETIALALVRTAAASAAWPYLSTIWRLTGDSRAGWLDGDPPFIRTFDLGFTAAELGNLAALLRRLHTAQSHFPAQSVRGGTQTEQPLFFRPEPEIAMAKARILEAVRAYVDALPPPVPGHPLLGTPRSKLLFEGSWSVRLKPGGFHVTHSHTRGWISSACYITVPDSAALGPAPAGWLKLGAPPPELKLDLTPYCQIEPQPGRLVLFPSTLWHSTVPFTDGERLSIACDVRVPRV
ncbi:MAG: putative 2OG-Fe(II) oxygenase [Sphingobium sp.]